MVAPAEVDPCAPAPAPAPETRPPPPPPPPTPPRARPRGTGHTPPRARPRNASLPSAALSPGTSRPSIGGGGGGGGGGESTSANHHRSSASSHRKPRSRSLNRSLSGHRGKSHSRSSTSILGTATINPATKCKWDEGVSVVQSLLQPGSATYQAMTLEQRHGLQQVEMILLQGIGGGTGTNQVSTMSHIPTELIRMESETATANLENSNYKYLMKEFGGVQESTAIRKVRTALIANTWAKHVYDRSSRKMQFLTAKSLSGRPLTEEHTPMISGDRGVDESDNRYDHPQRFFITRLYTPPEFAMLEKDVQLHMYQDYLNWDSLKRWDFNIFEVTKLCKGHPLLIVGWALLASPYAQTAMKAACGLLEEEDEDDEDDDEEDEEKEDDETGEDKSMEMDFSRKKKRRNHHHKDHYDNINGGGGGEGYNFCETFKIPQETLCDYLRAIERDYNSENPYHNEIHGADVIQTGHALLQMNKIVLTSTSSSTTNDPCSTTTITQLDDHDNDDDKNEEKDDPAPPALSSTSTMDTDEHTGEGDDERGDDGEVEELLNLTDLEKFSFLLAAAVHDVGHPGRNNSFQINRQTSLALEYNDLSVLENMHASKAFRRMFQVKDVPKNTTNTARRGSQPQQRGESSSMSVLPSFSATSSRAASMGDIGGGAPDSPAKMTNTILGKLGLPGNRGPKFQEPYNILRNMETDDRTKVRKMTVEAILHTDMSKHFVTVSKMKGLILSTLQQQQLQQAQQEQKQQQQEEGKMVEGDTDGDDDDETKDTTSNSPTPFQQHIATQLKDGNPWEVLCFMLHLADISNPAKPQPMLTDWTDRCLEEFFAQGDDEMKLGLPVSPNCNRKTTQRADSQIGFIKFVILPAYEVLAEFLPAVGDDILPIIEANLLYWTEIKANEEKSIAETAAAARAELQAIEKNRTPQVMERKIPGKSGGGGESTEGKTTTTKVAASTFLSKFNRNKAPTEGAGEDGSLPLSSEAKDTSTEGATTTKTAKMTNLLAQKGTAASASTFLSKFSRNNAPQS